MACNLYTYPLSTGTEDLGAHSHIITFTPRDCTPTCNSTVLGDCDDLWNCRDQSTNNNYYNPFIAGDKFMFQLKFIDRYNPDQEVPVDGWGTFMIAELLNNDGTVASTDHTLFASRYLVGWTGTESYQLIEIDFDLLTTNFPGLSDCFSFKFVAYDTLAAETDSICSQHFQAYTNDCKETLLINSTGATDCCDNYYGSPDASVGNANFKYNNVWRYHASIRKTNVEFEKTTFGVKRTKVELNKIYLLQLKRAIPPYLFNLLAEIHLAGERVFIGGEEYFIDDFSFNNATERKMFLGRIELFTECDRSFRCTT